jgi:hypothetical protein
LKNPSNGLTIDSLRCFIPFPLTAEKLGAWVAQLVEHMIENHGVGGSIPPPGTTVIQKILQELV